MNKSKSMAGGNLGAAPQSLLAPAKIRGGQHLNPINPLVGPADRILNQGNPLGELLPRRRKPKNPRGAR
jgi:hypothetical protein